MRAAWFVVLDTEVAKEIAQEAFCRALQRWDRIGRYDRPGAWVRTVANRLAVRSRDSIVVEAALQDLPRQQRAVSSTQIPQPGAS